MIDEIKNYIFVYGTIRKGGKNYSIIENEPNVRKIGFGITANKYTFIGAISGAYPYATEHSFDGIDKVNIIGELYEVLSQTFLEKLDKLEYNYIRKFVIVKSNDIYYKTNMYLLQDEELLDGIKKNLYPVGKKRFYSITSGDWLEKPILFQNLFVSKI